MTSRKQDNESIRENDNKPNQKQDENKIKRNHRDSTFRSLFSEPQNALELCNAIFDTQENDIAAIKIARLSESPIFHEDFRNDLGITFGDKALLLTEHQSTSPANMPLRMLIYYVGTLLEQLQKDDKQWRRIYSDVPLKIAVPRLVCVYQGEEDEDAVKILHLSDHFMETRAGDISDSVTVYNINNPACPLNTKCRKIWEFGEFFRIYHHCEINFKDEKEAMMQAIDECIEKGILAEFLKVNRSKVMMELSQRRAYKLARDAWIESGMERMRPELEAARAKANEADLRANEADLRANEADLRANEADLRAAYERKTREAAEVRANEAEKRAQDLEAELNLLKQQLNHKD